MVSRKNRKRRTQKKTTPARPQSGPLRDQQTAAPSLLMTGSSATNLADSAKSAPIVTTGLTPSASTGKATLAGVVEQKERAQIGRSASQSPPPAETEQRTLSFQAFNPTPKVNNRSQSIGDASSSALPSTRLLPMTWLLFSVALLVMWVAQGSINAYWQQTYHRASPLEYFNRFDFWQRGGQIQANLSERIGQMQADFLSLNEEQLQFRRSNAQAASIPESSTGVAANSALQPNASSTVTKNTPQPLMIEANSGKLAILKAGDEVLFAGDSLMQGVAPFVQQKLKQDYAINSVNLSKQSTGLSYPSFFDWPKTIETTLAANARIKLMVVFLGPNDPWNFPNPEQPQGPYLSFKSQPWEMVYRSRVARILAAAEAHRVQVIWMGVPAMRKPLLDEQMNYLNGVLSDAVAGKAIWLPTQPVLNTSSRYADSMLIDGAQVKLRSKDGIHFSLAGQKRLAQDVFKHIQYHP